MIICNDGKFGYWGDICILPTWHEVEIRAPNIKVELLKLIIYSYFIYKYLILHVFGFVWLGLKLCAHKVHSPLHKLSHTFCVVAIFYQRTSSVQHFGYDLPPQ